MTDIDEAALARRAREGDREAWGRLVQAHAPRLAAYLGARLRRPEVVEKLVAESIYAGWRKITELEDPEDFPAWFRRLGANLALRWHSKHKHEKLVGEFPVDRCQGDEALAEDMRRLEQALAQLEEQDRIALEQRFRGGLTGAALAEALHKRPEEVERAVADALDRLAAHFDRAAQSPP